MQISLGVQECAARPSDSLPSSLGKVQLVFQSSDGNIDEGQPSGAFQSGDGICYSPFTSRSEVTHFRSNTFKQESIMTHILRGRRRLTAGAKPFIRDYALAMRGFTLTLAAPMEGPVISLSRTGSVMKRDQK